MKAELITTTHGELPVALLERRVGESDNEVETTTWVEYWMPAAGECVGHDIVVDGMERVHRSVHVQLKRPVTLESAVGGIGG